MNVDEKTPMDDRLAVVVGGSAGSIEALSSILSRLPPGFPVPVAVVLHRGQGPSPLAETLAARSSLPVEDAQDKAPFEAGRVYVAPGGYHLLLDAGPRLALSIDGPVNHSMPAIDVLFESAAELFGARLVGVVLSGASDDGARGLQAVAARGGLALAQSPTEAVAPIMPQAALRLCPQARALTTEAIGELLASATRPLSRSGVVP